MKKILVTGADGYIGSILCPYLENKGYNVVGYDTDFFGDCALIDPPFKKIVHKDVRDIEESDLKDINVLIHLAGVSNDPFGNLNPKKIYDPTREYSKKIALLCKKLGIKFIFASSCSIYGKGGNEILNEESTVHPQSYYSINKLQIEEDLKELSDKNFSPIALRFATVFGFSPRIRFDIVINMFVGMALTSNKIILNSDGKAWRPNVHILDVCKAIDYTIKYDYKDGKLLILNVGDSRQNHQIIDLAKIVQQNFKSCEIVFLNQNNNKIDNDIELIKDRKLQDGADLRTYKISFEKIRETLPGFKCDFSVEEGIKMLANELSNINLTKEKFESRMFYRLQWIEDLFKSKMLDENLRWSQPKLSYDWKLNRRHILWEGKRVYIKTLQVEDITQDYVNSLNDIEVVKLTEAKHQNWNWKDVEEYVKNGTQEGKSHLIGVFLKDSNKHIGNVRLSGFSSIHKRVDLGIMIFDKSEWGKGYGTEIINCVVDYVFNKLKLHKICADYYSINKASDRLFEKCGFKIESIFNDHFILDGKYVDSVRIYKINDSLPLNGNIMKVMLLADYKVGYEVAKYLLEVNEEIVALGIHPKESVNTLNIGYTDKIINLIKEKNRQVHIFVGKEVNEKHEEIKKINPDIILSIMWGYILKKEVIGVPQKGCINLHLSYLPYNRGKNPNVWSIVENTPAGVTLHYIDEGIDTGRTIAKKKIEVKSIDTGESLYWKLINGAIELFKEQWEYIKEGKAQGYVQSNTDSTFHYGKDFKKLDLIELDKKYYARDLINILKARTFPPFASSYFIDDEGKKVYVRLALEYADDYNYDKTLMIKAEKKRLRNEMNRILEQIPNNIKLEKSDVIIERLDNLELWQENKNVMVYLSYQNEVSTKNLVKKLLEMLKNDKISNIIVPYTNDKKIVPCILDDIDNLERGPYNIYVPREKKIYTGDINIIIVPGIAFDKKCNRLGRGKGYYDEFLSNCSSKKVGLAFNDQIVENVPLEEHDVPMDIVITENEYIKR